MCARRPCGPHGVDRSRRSNVGAVAITFDTPAAMRAWSETIRAEGHTLALVPTMGALHAGHLELFDAAARLADIVVVSIFVNPLQFGEQGDFDHYPRPLEDDLRACTEAGVDVVYVPTAAAMYPDGFATSVHVAGLSTTMEGSSRPGHFDGVTTVVTKLFAATRPHLAMFGEKDYQQLAIVRRMADDLDLGVEIVAHPTVREPDGVALSSRNRRLTNEQRRAATCVPRAISTGQDTANSERSSASDVIEAAAFVIGNESLASLDYVAVFDSATLAPIEIFDAGHRQPGRVRIALAVRFGDVRLIDNADLFGR
jgi:pantoate--beta-alanine ligase